MSVNWRQTASDVLIAKVDVVRAELGLSIQEFVLVALAQYLERRRCEDKPKQEKPPPPRPSDMLSFD